MNQFVQTVAAGLAVYWIVQKWKEIGSDSSGATFFEGVLDGGTTDAATIDQTDETTTV